MKNRKFTLFAKNIVEREFCGQTFWEIESNGIYEPPFETKPTNGIHDFNTCETCIEVREVGLKEVTEIFKNRNFPYCCEQHKKLLSLSEFKKSHFDSVPEMTTNKIVYTKQHIINNIRNDNYYKEITDYIVYTIESFGKMPNGYGSRLFLKDYISNVIDTVRHYFDKSTIPKDRSTKILKFLEAHLSPTYKNQKDLNFVKNIYEKWFKIFPFDLSIFESLKPYFQLNWLPIITGESEYNPYLKEVRFKLHTKESLIDILLELTNDILTKINTTSLYEQGKLTKPQKVKLELIVSERKMKLKEGYINNSENESSRFIKVLKEWYKDEKDFIDKITPLLKGLPPIEIEEKTLYKEKIGRGEMDKVIKELLEKNKSCDKEVYNDLIQISSRYNKNEKDFDSGLINNEEANINRNNVSKALINLIDRLNA